MSGRNGRLKLGQFALIVPHRFNHPAARAKAEKAAEGAHGVRGHRAVAQAGVELSGPGIGVDHLQGCGGKTVVPGTVLEGFDQGGADALALVAGSHGDAVNVEIARGDLAIQHQEKEKAVHAGDGAVMGGHGRIGGRQEAALGVLDGQDAHKFSPGDGGHCAGRLDVAGQERHGGGQRPEGRGQLGFQAGVEKTDARGDMRIRQVVQDVEGLSRHGRSHPSLVTDFVPDLTELGPDPSGRDAHGDGLHRTDLIVREAVFFGHAKEVFHSGITPHHERCSQLNHDRCFRVQLVILGG